MILFHVCCADCMVKGIEAIRGSEGGNQEIRPFFYNPNIHPQMECLARQTAVQKVALENKLDVIVANWTPKEYFAAIGNLSPQDRRRRELRCPHCWYTRLLKTFVYASEHTGFSAVSTTMLTSHYMDRDRIIAIGRGLSGKYGIPFFVPVPMVCDHVTRGFYKQNYCGCVYSLLDRMEEKFLG